MLFFLWEHDHYMKDDRQVHELSYLYSDSLFKIRERSDSLMSTCRSFLKTDRSRIDWVTRLDGYRAAFEICDATGDGKIDKSELENMLARFTADGGTTHGLQCKCAMCTDWRKEVTVMEVDWTAFGEKFRELDDDNSGSLEFRECPKASLHLSSCP